MNKPTPAHNIGTYVPMIDGPEKVSGRAKYTADILGAGQLAGRIYRSPYSHGEIVNVDVSEALKVPGVVSIVTGADCDKTFGVLPVARSEHPLARDRVRYRGEPVAAVAAIDDAAAREAVRRIKLTVRELPAYYTAKDALAPGATLLHEKKPGNIERDVLFELGSAAKGFAEADLVHEGTYNCAEVCQNQMEMHAAVAEYDAVRDRMTVHASTQVPYYVHLMLSQILGMDMSRLRVIKPHVGGAHSGYGIVTILYSGSMLYAIYDLHNVKYVGRRALTNTPPCGAFRGHGTVDIRFAFESLVDQMATELGLDPFTVRRANYLPAPGAKPTFTDN